MKTITKYLLLLSILIVAVSGAFSISHAGPPGKTVNKKDGSEMLLIPAGEFTMGSEGGFSDERPPHKVYLGDFYIDKYEITNSQYKKFVEAAGHRIPVNATDPDFDLWPDKKPMPGIDNQPVVNVCWEDAEAYCKWAGKRLPTEAEWEKAARGTDNRQYPWGNDSPAKKGARYEIKWQKDKTFSDVGSFAAGASPYGVMDLAGNASEWVADWYSLDYYRQSPNKNPCGPVSGYHRVVRGGSLFDADYYLRTTDRDYNMVTDCFRGLGFRCARAAK